MDRRCRCIDNIFVKRLWRSLKREEAFLHACDDMREANAVIRGNFAFFSTKRKHQSLGYQTPESFYSERFPKAA